jgi:hypothetical protein
MIADPDPHLFESKIRIRIRINFESKIWIRIRIEVEIQELQRLKNGAGWRAVDAHNGGSKWSPEGSEDYLVVVDSHQFDEEQDPDPH